MARSANSRRLDQYGQVNGGLLWCQVVSAGGSQPGGMVRWGVEASPTGLLGTDVVGLVLGTQATTGGHAPTSHHVSCQGDVYPFVSSSSSSIECQARLHWNEMDPCFGQLDHWMVRYGMVSWPVWVLSGHVTDQTSTIGGSEQTVCTNDETVACGHTVYDASNELLWYEMVSVIIHRLLSQWLVWNSMDARNTGIVSSYLTHQAIPGIGSIVESIDG